MTLRAGHLFAGYDGLGMAVEAIWPDSEIAWFSDVCKFGKDGKAGHHEPHRAPCSILAHHYPDVPNLGDVTAVDWAQVEPVDILTGGSPCQDLSHAGKRAGMTEGTRSNLWVAMREAIAQLRPGLVIWENVRGAYSAAADSDMEPCSGCLGDGSDEPALRALGRVLGDLSELGYVGGWHGLRAADVGAPHGRLRVFVVAEDASRERERDWSPAPLPESRTESSLRSVRPGRGPVPVERELGEDDLALLPTPAVNDMGAAYTPDEWDAWTDRMKAAHGNGNGHGKSLNIEAQRLLPTPKASNNENAPRRDRHGIEFSLNLGQTISRLLPTPVVSDTQDMAPGGQKSRGYGSQLRDLEILKPALDWGPYAGAVALWEGINGPAPAPTEIGAKGNPRLSPAFSEWLMGLPVGWVTDVPGITRNEALKALGNGVVPQQAEAAIRWLLARLPWAEAS